MPKLQFSNFFCKSNTNININGFYMKCNVKQEILDKKVDVIKSKPFVLATVLPSASYNLNNTRNYKISTFASGLLAITLSFDLTLLW